jgi:fumarate reductase subunit D
MTEDISKDDQEPVRYAWTRRTAGKIPLSTAIALVFLFAVALIAASIGIVQAETLSAMVEDETGRLALLGLVVLVAVTGAATSFVMWLTAPSPASARSIHRI